MDKQDEILEIVHYLKDNAVHKEDFCKLRDDFGVLKTDVGALKTDVGMLKTDFGVLKTDVGALKTDVGVLKTDVGALKTDVGALKTDVGALKTDVGVLKTDVGALKTDVGGFHDKLECFRYEIHNDMSNLENRMVEKIKESENRICNQIDGFLELHNKLDIESVATIDHLSRHDQNFEVISENLGLELQ